MKCPGQDTRYWQIDSIFEIKCPQCGHMIEFFKDDTSRICGNCGHRTANPRMDFGCAAYCKFADQCIGALAGKSPTECDDLIKKKNADEKNKPH